MDKIVKLRSFEYLVLGLVRWFKESNPTKDFDSRNDLSKLKVIKLHFFVSTVNANHHNSGLLYIFDQFYAMPYGHVEGEIYNWLNETQSFKLTKEKLFLDYGFLNNENTYFTYFKPIDEHKKAIDFSIDSLKSKNEDLINYSVTELVELSHKWSSWRSAFNSARERNKYSQLIPNELIQSEIKSFHLAIPSNAY